jgi:hypothetical protein
MADMIENLPEAVPPKRQRRWLQFSLRTLMIFKMICAIGSAWLGRKIERKRRERETIDAILNNGGFVTYDFKYDADDHFIPKGEPSAPTWLRKLLGDDFFSEVDRVSFLVKNPGPTWLRAVGIDEATFRIPAVATGLPHLEELTFLRRLSLTERTITDADMSHLKDLSRLQYLGLRDPAVSDAGLVGIKVLTQLRILTLTNARLTDAGMVNLDRLTQLRKLDLAGTKITDAGLKHLKGMSQLESLILRGTQITDAGLVNVMQLTKLQTLELDRTHVTGVGVIGLQKALPKCTTSY